MDSFLGSFDAAEKFIYLQFFVVYFRRISQSSCLPRTITTFDLVTTGTVIIAQV